MSTALLGQTFGLAVNKPVGTATSWVPGFKTQFCYRCQLPADVQSVSPAAAQMIGFLSSVRETWIQSLAAGFLLGSVLTFGSVWEWKPLLVCESAASPVQTKQFLKVKLE